MLRLNLENGFETERQNQGIGSTSFLQAVDNF
jgi:hypothetical protein